MEAEEKGAAPVAATPTARPKSEVIKESLRKHVAAAKTDVQGRSCTEHLANIHWVGKIKPMEDRRGVLSMWLCLGPSSSILASQSRDGEDTVTLGNAKAHQ